jgi:hypothetical protein
VRRGEAFLLLLVDAASLLRGEASLAASAFGLFCRSIFQPTPTYPTVLSCAGSREKTDVHVIALLNLNDVDLSICRKRENAIRSHQFIFGGFILEVSSVNHCLQGIFIFPDVRSIQESHHGCVFAMLPRQAVPRENEHNDAEDPREGSAYTLRLGLDSEISEARVCLGTGIAGLGCAPKAGGGAKHGAFVFLALWPQDDVVV